MSQRWTRGASAGRFVRWTRTIVKAHSKSEVHAVYDGHADGSVKTTDALAAYGTKLAPNETAAWFAWGFSTPK